MNTQVNISTGALRGSIENGLHIFKGVPYAVFMLLTVGGCVHFEVETS